MKKKIYQQPEIKVVELDQADIIATSTQTDGFGIKDGEGFEEADW